MPYYGTMGVDPIPGQPLPTTTQGWAEYLASIYFLPEQEIAHLKVILDGVVRSEQARLDECASALIRLAEGTGVASEGPDEIVSAVLERLGVYSSVAQSTDLRLAIKVELSQGEANREPAKHQFTGKCDECFCTGSQEELGAVFLINKPIPLASLAKVVNAPVHPWLFRYQVSPISLYQNDAIDQNTGAPLWTLKGILAAVDGGSAVA